MSRLVSCIMVIIAMNALMCVHAEEELYPDRYDNLDIRVVLEDKNLQAEYYTCFMELSPCKTPVQQALAGLFSEAYQTNCKKCTKKQKERMDFLVDWFVNNQPEIWQQIVAKTVEDRKKQIAAQELVTIAGNTD